MRSELEGLIIYLRANLQGWPAVVMRGVRILTRLFSRFNIFMILFLISCLMVIFLSLAHWIGYEIKFNAVVYSTLGSEMRYAFFFPGFAGLLLFGYQIPYRRPICGAVIGVVALIYVLGLINPGWIHTSMQSASDYHLRYGAVVSYGVALALMAGTFWEALRQPLLNQSIVKEYLYATREETAN